MQPVEAFGGEEPRHRVGAALDQDPAQAAAVVAAVRVATIGGAYFFQFVLGLPPCPLCLEQRTAYYVAIPLAAGVLAPWGILLHPAVGAVLMSASTVIVAINAQLLRRAHL